MWRKHFGRRYPAMGLFGVTELFEPAAKVELMGVAVLSRGRADALDLHLSEAELRALRGHAPAGADRAQADRRRRRTGLGQPPA